MISNTVKNKLKVSLTENLEDWWETESGNMLGDIPWLGDNTIDNMAESVLLILLSLDDAQDWMSKEGMFTEDV